MLRLRATSTLKLWASKSLYLTKAVATGGCKRHELTVESEAAQVENKRRTADTITDLRTRRVALN